MTSPRFDSDIQKASPSKRSGRVRLKRIKDWLRFAKGGNNYMGMIGADINCAKLILVVKTNFTHCLLDHGSLLRVKRHWLMLQLASLGAFECWLRENAGRSV